MALQILVVSGSTMLRKLVEKRLRRSAAEPIEAVLEAHDGREALEVLGRQPVDVVLCGIGGDPPNCLGFLRELQQSPHRGAPLIVLSAAGEETTVTDAIALGAAGYVRKPFATEQLRAVLTKALESVIPVP